MAMIDDAEAFSIHVMGFSDSDSDAEGKQEFDEEYAYLKPPPLKLDQRLIVEISSEDSPPNFWEERLKATLNGDENANSPGETSAGGVKKKNVDESDEKKENIPNGVNTGRKQSNKISYDAETLKKLREHVENLDEKSIWHYGLDENSVVDELNTLRSKEREILSCFKGTPFPTLNQNTPKKEKKKKSKKEIKKINAEKTDENGEQIQQETVVSEENQAVESSSAPSGADLNKKSCLEQFENVFGQDFRDFIQNIVADGTSINDLSSFTYEQLNNTYKAYQRKKAQTKKKIPVQPAPVPSTTHCAQPNNVFYPFAQPFNNTYSPAQPFYNGPLYPPRPPVNFNPQPIFPQNNVGWNFGGNPNTNMIFFLNSIPNMNQRNVPMPSEPLKLTEIKDDVTVHDLGPIENKINMEVKNKKPAQPTATASGVSGKIEGNGVEKGAIPKILDIPSVSGNNGTLENDDSSENKIKPSQIVGEPLDGSVGSKKSVPAANNVEKSAVTLSALVESVPVGENRISKRKRKKAEQKTGSEEGGEGIAETNKAKELKKLLHAFLQPLEEGRKMMDKASKGFVERSKEAKKSMSEQDLSALEKFVSDILEINKTGQATIKSGLEAYKMVLNERKLNQFVTNDTWERFKAAIESHKRVSLECLGRLLHQEIIFSADCNNDASQQFLPFVSVMSTCLIKCTQGCEAAMQKITEGDWEGVIKDVDLRLCLRSPNEDVKPSVTVPDNNEKLSLRLVGPNDSLKSLGAASGETPANEPKENNYEGENAEGGIASGDSTLGSSVWQDICKIVTKFEERIKFHATEVFSDNSPSNVAFITLALYLVVETVRSIATFLSVNFPYIFAAVLFYLIARNKK